MKYLVRLKKSLWDDADKGGVTIYTNAWEKIVGKDNCGRCVEATSKENAIYLFKKHHKTYGSTHSAEVLADFEVNQLEVFESKSQPVCKPQPICKSNPPTVEIPEWKVLAESMRRDGECPCGMPRELCDYHK